MSTARPPQGTQDRSAQREGTPVRIGGALLRHLGALCLALSMALPAGCGAAPPAEERVSAPDTDDAAAPRELFVFFDGTRNDPSSATNVWRLYEAVGGAGRRAIYIEGVGTTETPVFGAAWGLGMEDRILRGYAHLSSNYRTGDKIFIFGFSRGAHQARALAGLLAYAGLIGGADRYDARRLHRLGNKVLELTKRYDDLGTKARMRADPETPPLLGAIASGLGLSNVAAPVEFLGLWDTVPGSSFKTYKDCREVADRRKGDRYKVGSYPLIRHIAHAVALDEKRSKFAPIVLCPPVLDHMTRTDEQWFAGAHSDVGGGYAASTMHLASLNWMAELLRPHLGAEIAAFPEAGSEQPAHWSMADAPGNLGSECIDRPLPDGATLHPSAQTYRRAANAPLRIKGKKVDSPNPPRCANVGAR